MGLMETRLPDDPLDGPPPSIPVKTPRKRPETAQGAGVVSQYPQRAKRRTEAPRGHSEEMAEQTANSGEGEQTMNEELTLDSFRPLIEADEKRRRAAADFRDAENRARGLLRDIRARQAADRRKFSEMLSGLKAEEQSLRQKVREETAARAKAAARGEETPRADTSTGARLAALPDEMAALESLISEQRMTDEEREAWTKTVMELSERATAYKQAGHAARGELVKWKVYFFEAVNYPKWGMNDDINGIVQEGYELNRAAEQW